MVNVDLICLFIEGTPWEVILILDGKNHFYLEKKNKKAFSIWFHHLFQSSVYQLSLLIVVEKQSGRSIIIHNSPLLRKRQWYYSVTFLIQGLLPAPTSQSSISIPFLWWLTEQNHCAHGKTRGLIGVGFGGEILACSLWFKIASNKHNEVCWCQKLT